MHFKLPWFKVSKRAVRERYTLLSEKFKAKMKDEEKASESECDLSEVEKALEEIAEEEVAAEDSGTREEESWQFKTSGNEKQSSREFGQNT